jgi:hypothetical protein
MLRSAGAGWMPIEILAVRIRAFCAPVSVLRAAQLARALGADLPGLDQVPSAARQAAARGALLRRNLGMAGMTAAARAGRPRPGTDMR